MSVCNRENEREDARTKRGRCDQRNDWEFGLSVGERNSHVNDKGDGLEEGAHTRPEGKR